MLKKISAILLILIVAFSFSILPIYAQENQTIKTTSISPSNQIFQFMEKTIDNPILKIIGIKESVSMKELIICICLMIISLAIIWGAASFAEIISGIGVNFSISTIIVLIASQSGIFIKIAKELTTIPASIEYLISHKITIIIILLVLIALIPLSRFLKKTIRKTKEEERKEEMKKRENKVEMLAKIKDYETDVELKRYGVKDSDSL